MLLEKVGSYFDSFIQLLYPEQCPSCKTTLINKEPICNFCEAGIPRTQSHIIEFPQIDRNIVGKMHPKHTFSFMTYVQKGMSQEIIFQIKYKGRADLAEYLGYKYSLELMEKGIFLDDNYTIVPVPLHPKKLKKRGYNQAEEIGKGICKAFGFPLLTNALIRTQNNESQTKKGKERRWDEVSNAFALNETSCIENKNIILVDDVFTTGSTFEACYNSLIKANPKSISLVSLAVRV